MPRRTFQKVYLHDNYPSDISARVTIRESLWNIISTIESNTQQQPLHCTFIGELDETLAIDEADYGLPLSFGKQPPLKKPKKHKNAHKTVKDENRKFIEFSEMKSTHNLYMGYNEGDGLFYPCRIWGVGPRSRPGKEYAMVQFIGYGTTAELERTVALQRIPTERINEINEYVMMETLYQAVGGVEDIKKYYDQRYRLFSKFDQGVMLDRESWFSITPECVSIDIADKCQSQAVKHNVRIGMIVDCFCGVGGNVISMAGRVDCQVVVAGDIDKLKLDMLRCNAKIYGVASRVECVHEDAYNIMKNFSAMKRRGQFFRQELHNICDAGKESIVDSPTVNLNEGTVTDTCPLPQLDILQDQPPGGGAPGAQDSSLRTLQNGCVDILVLAPPWGGVNYTNTKSAFDLRTMITSGNGMELFEKAVQVFSNIIYILPKNTKKKDLLLLAQHSRLYCRVEDVHIHNKLKMIVAYFGPLFAPGNR